MSATQLSPGTSRRTITASTRRTSLSPQDFKTVASNAIAKSQADVEELAGTQRFCDYGARRVSRRMRLLSLPRAAISAVCRPLLLFHDCVNPATLEGAYSGLPNLPPA
ncbi:hypothetical protein DL769_005821 [Monosporascus sp. CRB-8-3]|nr:hypothetical protein DL769_005821 [Monosporascus sp. CRB-8-3]